MFNVAMSSLGSSPGIPRNQGHGIVVVSL